MNFYAGSVFDPLIGITPDGLPGPGIAQSWVTSADGKTWTFNIRKGVKFQDGSDLTAADVKFSFERVMATDSTNPSAADFRNTIASIELPDNYTVVMRLKSPQGELWKGTTAPNNSPSMILPKKYIEEKGADYFNKNPIGSGPYKVVKYEYQKSITLEAVGNWRVMPKVKTINIIAVPEEATRVAMLKTGEIDLTGISPDAVKEVKAAGLQVFQFPTGVADGVSFYYDLKNPSKHALGDPRVRKALSIGINRQEMASVLFSGYARPAAVYNAPSTTYFFDPAIIKPEPYDPDQAKKLLAEAGYASGFDMKLYDVPFAAWTPTANQAIAGYWLKLGVRVQTVPMQWSAMLPMLSPNQSPDVWGNALASLSSGGSGFQVNLVHLSNGFHKNHQNAQLDSLISQTNAEMDMAKRVKLAQQALLAMQAEHASIGIVEFDALYGMGKKIQGWSPIKGSDIPAFSFDSLTLAK